MRTSISVADPPVQAEPDTPAPPERRRTCRYLRWPRQERCTAEALESIDDGAEVELCEHHLAKAWMLLARRGVVPGPELNEAAERQREAAAVALLLELAETAQAATTWAEQIRINEQMVAIARTEAEERRARSDRLISDLLAPKAEPGTDQEPIA